MITNITNGALLELIESMENHYVHAMRTNHAFLSEKFTEIDEDRIYSNEEVEEFFKKHPDLYDTGWLDGYGEAISELRNRIT